MKQNSVFLKGRNIITMIKLTAHAFVMLDVRSLAEEVANTFFLVDEQAKEGNTPVEGIQGSIDYWNHVHSIENIITDYVQTNDLTNENG